MTECDTKARHLKKKISPSSDAEQRRFRDDSRPILHSMWRNSEPHQDSIFRHSPLSVTKRRCSVENVNSRSVLMTSHFHCRHSLAPWLYWHDLNRRPWLGQKSNNFTDHVTQDKKVKHCLLWGKIANLTVSFLWGQNIINIGSVCNIIYIKQGMTANWFYQEWSLLQWVRTI